MSHPQDATKITGVSMTMISNLQKEPVISFKAKPDTNEVELEKIRKAIIGNILCSRNVIVVTKGAKLIELISDAVNDKDQEYVKTNSREVAKFIPEPESTVEHIATLVNRIPLEVVKDLANSSEFIYGNMWFVIPANITDIDQCRENLIDDVRKLTPSTFLDTPVLKHEAIAVPAMFDGLAMLWFNPNTNIYDTLIKPLF